MILLASTRKCLKGKHFVWLFDTWEFQACLHTQGEGHDYADTWPGPALSRGLMLLLLRAADLTTEKFWQAILRKKTDSGYIHQHDLDSTIMFRLFGGTMSFFPAWLSKRPGRQDQLNRWERIKDARFGKSPGTYTFFQSKSIRART